MNAQGYGPHFFTPRDVLIGPDGQLARVVDSTVLYATIRDPNGLREIEQCDPDWFVKDRGIGLIGTAACADWIARRDAAAKRIDEITEEVHDLEDERDGLEREVRDLEAKIRGSGWRA